MPANPYLLPQRTLLNRMKRTTRGTSQFKFHEVPGSSDEDEQPAAPQESLRHLHFNTSRNAAGPSRSAYTARASHTTYVTGDASPIKELPVRPHSPGPDLWNDEPGPPEINTTNYPWLDPAYQHQIELDLLSYNVPPRVRTAGVSQLSTIIRRILYIYIKDDPLALWTVLRAEYLAELLRLEGRGRAGVQTRCILCLEGNPDFLCSDCFGQDLFCQGCIVSCHEANPLHRVEVCRPFYYLCLLTQNSSVGRDNSSSASR